jgi:hypothetical protein
MMFVAALVPVLFMALYYIWMRRFLTSPERVRATQAFFERTGFRLHGREHLPLAAQAAEATFVPTLQVSDRPPLTARPYVRDLDVGRITYFHASFPNGETWGAPYGQSGWVLQLREPLAVRCSLVRGRGANRPPPHDPRVDVGQPELDGLRAFAPDAAVLAEILAVPGLAPALARCAHIDLHVRGSLVLLLDPRCELLHSEGGGAVAHLTVMYDPHRQMDLIAMAHERVMDLLIQVADASRNPR